MYRFTTNLLFDTGLQLTKQTNEIEKSRICSRGKIIGINDRHTDMRKVKIERKEKNNLTETDYWTETSYNNSVILIKFTP